ncbi:MAG TPA: hypothetical protein VMU17_02685 [Elusimicrobiota bacterium]|nr:hypothetical protein [Elusimicrobiota bacterium]
MKRAFLVVWVLAAPLSAAPDNHRFDNGLLPAVVDMVSRVAAAVPEARYIPHYVSIALGKNEYVYSLRDKQFIRCITDRYELPPWRLCGDFAEIRVAMLGDAMEPVTPETVWYLAYRDGQWIRLVKDDEGHFERTNLMEAILPAYAVRCFNLDNKELLDR